MSRRAGLLVVCGLLSPALALGQGVSIDHQGVGCVLAGRFPRFDARLDPAGEVARARLNFRPEGGAHWYYVEMKPEAGLFHGVLPKPQKTLHRFSYYIDVTDKRFNESRTAEFAPDVASGPAACRKEKLLAPGLAKARVLVHAPEGVTGVPGVPAGFAADGVVTASAATQTATTAASGGGLGPTALVVGGVAIAGGAAAVIASSKGDEGGSSQPAPPPTGGSAPQPAPTPSPGGPTPPSGGPSAAAGSYVLEQLDGAPLPVIVVTTPCTGFADSGTLVLGTNPQNYTMTETTRFECQNGPGPINPHSDGGSWSESGGVVTFTPFGSSVFNPSTGTRSGNTLTLSMDILSDAMGVPPRRFVAVWRKQ